ncbi:MAG: AAA family ATPase [Bradymonadia bacterium]
MSKPTLLTKPDSEQASVLRSLRERLNSLILGKAEVIDLALTTLLGGGHLLLEDVPGVGKTTLARQLAGAFTGQYQRIQFTSDLLPMDVIGIQVYKKSVEQFEFTPGPIFANFVLADEINRAAPKTQSCLLQAMNEREVSVDRSTHALPKPFMVIATQNPLSFEGTFALPESQLDRFMMAIEMGYPDREAERQLLAHKSMTDRSVDAPIVSLETLIELQAQVEEVHCDEDVLSYLQDIVDGTRTRNELKIGVSPRGALTLLKASKAHALLQERTYVTPHDIKRLVIPCLAHRVTPAASHSNQGHARTQSAHILSALLSELVVPT